jgi:FkbM family methyltransferase
VWGGDVAWPALPEVVAIMVNRRDFIGGALCGSAAVVGGGARPTVAEPPTPPAPAPALPDHARLSFSQQGEDIVLYHVLHDLLEIAVPTFMDVGAAYPVQGNNTYLLYTTGARGVLVEPNPTFAAELRRHRPGDTVIQAGIGVGKAREANYYEIEGYPVLNTFSPEQVEYLRRTRPGVVVDRVVKMPLLNINQVMAEHLGRAPDLLSTDVEGLDEAILRSLDLSQFRPGVICAEAVPALTSGKPTTITRYLAARGYIPRGGSVHNTIYVDARRLDA